MSTVCDRISRCPEWEKNVKKIDTIFYVAARYNVKYDGDIYKFCPWCGKEIIWRGEQ